VTTVIKVPPSLDEETFEKVLEQVAALPEDARMLLDARHTTWASPYGLTALLTLGQARRARATLAAPESDTTLSYWSRCNFFYYAADLFELTGVVPKRPASGESPALLPITPVSGSEDVHQVVGHIQERAQQIITTQLRLDRKAIIGFAMTLSEICQNIIEHAGQGGWVMVQAYNYRQRLDRQAVVIAVCDAGIGFRKSLESATHRPLPERWDDGAALEAGLLRGVSRFRDPGRGQGLAGVRKYIGKWDGKVSIRSGTARIAIVPSWDNAPPLLERLPYFPGAQVQVTIPELATR
jgi:anti-sigma regulatory factor (Ser/Thr protein kinase)